MTLFFMGNYFLKLITHPAFLFNIISIGVLIVIGILHNHAHYSMEVDANSYVLQWCDKNPKKCTYNRDW